MPFTRTTSQRPHILLLSGNTLDLGGADPDSWTNADLAIGLLRTRWGGSSQGPQPVSRAQHSLCVPAIDTAEAGTTSPGRASYELLHDPEEALRGVQCLAPLKPQVRQPFRALLDRQTGPLADRDDLPALGAADRAAPKRADRIAAASGALHVVYWPREQARATLQISEQAVAQDPLTATIGGRHGHPIPVPWPSALAARAWLAEPERVLAAGNAR